MKKIKVYLQAPLSTSDSQYYKNLLNFPPKNVEYKTNISKAENITNLNKFKFFNFTKGFVRRITNTFGLPILNIHSSSKGDYDLIHCAHCLSQSKETPWVADFESPWQFWISGKDTCLGSKVFERVCSRHNCKKLLAWTEQAKKELVIKFPKLKEKIDVLGYAMPFIKFKKKKSNKITLLFSARYFYQKGGLHALEAIDNLTKKYDNVYGKFISEVPEKVKAKYQVNNKITFYGLIPQDKLFNEIYPSSDIFVYPGYSDTFGFGFIEAMNFGLPIVTVDGYARKEIVTEGKTGFVLEKKEKADPYKLSSLEQEIIKSIVKQASLLIENKKLRQKMSKNCMYEVKTGKFSIKRRNEKLREIYSYTIS